MGSVGLAVALAAAPALADDGSAQVPGAGPMLVIGGPDDAAPDMDSTATHGSLLLGLERYLSQTRFTLGTNPGSGDALGGPGSATNSYAEIGLGGFSLGGRYSHWLESDPLHSNDHSYGVGATYNLDSWTLGIDWTRGNYDEVFLDVGNGNDADVYAFTTSYALRPGVHINGLLEYSDSKSGQAGAASGNLAIGIGTLINF